MYQQHVLQMHAKITKVVRAQELKISYDLDCPRMMKMNWSKILSLGKLLHNPFITRKEKLLVLTDIWGTIRILLTIEYKS